MAGLAAWIAHVSFWILLPYGWYWEEISVRGLVTFLLLWVAGWLGLPFIPYGAGLFSSFVAILDIALVFVIFKGDVRLT